MGLSNCKIGRLSSIGKYLWLPIKRARLGAINFFRRLARGWVSKFSDGVGHGVGNEVSDGISVLCWVCVWGSKLSRVSFWSYIMWPTLIMSLLELCISVETWIIENIVFLKKENELNYSKNIFIAAKWYLSRISLFRTL